MAKYKAKLEPLSAGRLSLALRRGLAMAGAAVFTVTAACGSMPAGGGEVVTLPGDLPAAVDGAAAAAMACGLHVYSTTVDPERTHATLVLLADWRAPRPESSLVTLDLRASPAGVEACIEAHPLAEYGMRPPEAGAGGGAPSCLPCAAARAEIKTYHYSHSLAAGNAIRVRKCIREALTGSAP